MVLVTVLIGDQAFEPRPVGLVSFPEAVESPDLLVPPKMFPIPLVSVTTLKTILENN